MIVFSDNSVREVLERAFRAGAEHADSFSSVPDDKAFAEWWRLQHDLTPIEDLRLSPRPYNVLVKNGIHTVGALRPLLEPGAWNSVWDFRNFGVKSYEETLRALQRWDERHAHDLH